MDQQHRQLAVNIYFVFSTTKMGGKPQVAINFLISHYQKKSLSPIDSIPIEALQRLPRKNCHVITEYKLHFSSSDCCFIILFYSTSRFMYTNAMLILIKRCSLFMDCCFSIAKGLNVQKNLLILIQPLHLSPPNYLPGKISSFPYLENPEVCVSAKG